MYNSVQNLIVKCILFFYVTYKNVKLQVCYFYNYQIFIFHCAIVILPASGHFPDSSIVQQSSPVKFAEPCFVDCQQTKDKISHPNITAAILENQHNSTIPGDSRDLGSKYISANQKWLLVEPNLSSTDEFNIHANSDELNITSLSPPLKKNPDAS